MSGAPRAAPLPPGVAPAAGVIALGLFLLLAALRGLVPAYLADAVLALAAGVSVFCGLALGRSGVAAALGGGLALGIAAAVSGGSAAATAAAPGFGLASLAALAAEPAASAAQALVAGVLAGRLLGLGRWARAQADVAPGLGEALVLVAITAVAAGSGEALRALGAAVGGAFTREAALGGVLPQTIGALLLAPGLFHAVARAAGAPGLGSWMTPAGLALLGFGPALGLTHEALEAAQRGVDAHPGLDRLQSALSVVASATVCGLGALLIHLGRVLAQREAHRTALAQSEHRFRRMAALSSDWYWRQDAELRFVELTSRWGDRTAGHGKPQLAGRRPSLGLRRWEIPGLTPLHGRWDEHRATLEARAPYRDFVMRVALADGSTGFVSVSGEPVFSAAGEFTGYRGVSRDVTTQYRLSDELQRAKQALESALDIAQVTIWEIALASGEIRFLHASPGERPARAPDEPGRVPTIGSFFERAHPEDAGPLRDTFAALRASAPPAAGAAERRWTARVRQAAGGAGGWRWTEHAATVSVRAADGTPLTAIGASIDVTDRRAAEEHLQQLQRTEMIGQLAGGLAHDFNNLLGIVVGNLDLIGESLPAGDRLGRAHRTALDAAVRGASITRSLLGVARRQPLSLEVHDVAVLVAEMVPLITTSIGAAIEMHTQLHSGPLPARLDAGGLSNALLNLAVNARDALRSHAGARTVTLRTRLEQREPGSDPRLRAGAYAVIELADNGPGMTDEVRARALEPFFTTKQRGHGTGLGLSTVKGYVEQLGGAIDLVSAPGEGTQVRLYLPLEDGVAQQAPAAADARAGARSAQRH